MPGRRPTPSWAIATALVVLGVATVVLAGSMLIGPPAWAGSSARSSAITPLDHLPDSATVRAGVDRSQAVPRLDHTAALLTAALIVAASLAWARLGTLPAPGPRVDGATAAPWPSRAPPWARLAP